MEKQGLFADNEYWIETYTGRRVTPLHLQETEVSIKDIAHSLAHLCRYNGHCEVFYSVAEHSVRVCDMLKSPTFNYNDDVEAELKTRLAGLLHDASEAYMTDITRPIKYAIKGIKEMEDRAQGIILKKFLNAGYEGEYVHIADITMMRTEAHFLMPSKGEGWSFDSDIPILEAPVCLTPVDAKEAFLEMFFELYNAR